MVENAKAIIKLLRHGNCHALRKTPNKKKSESEFWFAFMSAHQMLKQVVASLQFTDIHSIYYISCCLRWSSGASITPAPAGSFSQSKQQQRLQCCHRQRILCTALSRGTVGQIQGLFWVCSDFPRQKHANRQTKPTFPSMNNMFGRLDRYDRLSYFLKSSRLRILGCKVAGKSALNRALVPSLAWTSWLAIRRATTLQLEWTFW